MLYALNKVCFLHKINTVWFFPPNVFRIILFQFCFCCVYLDKCTNFSLWLRYTFILFSNFQENKWIDILMAKNTMNGWINDWLLRWNTCDTHVNHLKHNISSCFKLSYTKWKMRNTSVVYCTPFQTVKWRWIWLRFATLKQRICLTLKDK